MGLIIPLLLLGVLASLSPSTLVVFILLLTTTRARVNATAFLLGWIVSLVIVFTASYTLGSFHPVQHADRGAAMITVEILLGIALIVLGGRQWRRRHLPRPNSGLPVGLTNRLDRIAPWGATVVGVLMQPWTLTAAAAVVVVRHHTGVPLALIAFVFFTAVSTATVGAIYLYYAREPGAADARLAALQAKVVEAGPVLAAGVTLLVGALLTVDAVIGALSH